MPHLKVDTQPIHLTQQPNYPLTIMVLWAWSIWYELFLVVWETIKPNKLSFPISQRFGEYRVFSSDLAKTPMSSIRG